MAYLPKIEEGLKHLHGRATEENISRSVAGYKMLLEKNPVKIFGPLGNLRSDYKSLALISWFQDHDIKKSKEHAFAASMVRRLENQYRPAAEYYGPASDLLYPLLSDNEEMIYWHTQFMLPLLITIDNKPTRCLEINNYEYHGMQARLALQGEWELLISRCEKRLATPPKKDKLHQIDYEFYIGLAQGDSVAMEDALNKLLSPKVAQHRNKEMQWGLEERLLSGWGFIYAKMAWRAGYQIELDSPWIQQEWLPTEPLVEYPLPHDFLNDLDIFKPFADNPNSWCKNTSKFSPNPPGETMLTFNKAIDLINN